MKTDAAAIFLAVITCVASMDAEAAKPLSNASTQTVDVSVPVGRTSFPPGPGSELADAHCVICHSPGMVLRQPPLSFDEWKAEVNKMRSVYAAPIPADKIEEVARYLSTINGKP
jgi:hypothetical protein